MSVTFKIRFSEKCEKLFLKGVLAQNLPLHLMQLTKYGLYPETIIARLLPAKIIIIILSDRCYGLAFDQACYIQPVRCYSYIIMYM